MIDVIPVTLKSDEGARASIGVSGRQRKRPPTGAAFLFGWNTSLVDFESSPGRKRQRLEVDIDRLATALRIELRLSLNVLPNLEVFLGLPWPNLAQRDFPVQKRDLLRHGPPTAHLVECLQAQFFGHDR